MFGIAHFGEILAIITAITWAAAVILFKKSGEQVQPLALNMFKNLLAFVLIMPTLWIAGDILLRPVPFNDYLLLLISGVLGIGVGDTLFLMSLNLLGASLQSIVNCLYSPSIIILSFLWLDERMSLLQIAGSVMIISAVLAATTKKAQGTVSPRNVILGILLGLGGSLGSAVGIVMIKPLLERSPLLWVSEIRLIGGIASLALVFLLHPRRKDILMSLHSRQSWGYTLCASFTGTYVSMLLWLAGMKYAQASVASALNQTANIFVFILATLFLREPANLQRIIGIILGVSGAMLVTFG